MISAFETKKTSTSDSDTSLAAQELYELGFNVLPTPYGQKEPDRKWGFLNMARLCFKIKKSTTAPEN